MLRVLCVCRGNLCRSPMAAAALSDALAASGVVAEVQSAGAAAWHVGDPAEPAAVVAAAAVGLDLTRHRARRMGPGDFERNDLMLAADSAVLRALRRHRPAGSATLLARFHPMADIPDPYYDGPNEFAAAMALIVEVARWQAARLSLRGLDGPCLPLPEEAHD
ncbi:MAG: low molecular weight phosphotyrosine protein phosphatase [Pseudomonadota bacterium]